MLPAYFYVNEASHKTTRPIPSPKVIKHSTCAAIRDAGNLAIEVGACLNCTDTFVPPQVQTASPRPGCLKATNLIGSSDQLKSPVIWDCEVGEVDFYEIYPWDIIEAEERGDKLEIANLRAPATYSYAMAQSKFGENPSHYWHLGYHTDDIPHFAESLSVKIVSDNMPKTSGSASDNAPPIGVLLEYCCDCLLYTSDAADE